MACRRERPSPARSWRNFGDEDRDSGQRRVPAPPAGTTAQKLSMAGIVVTGILVAGMAVSLGAAPPRLHR